MLRLCLAFVAGAAAASHLPRLPSAALVGALLALAVLLALPRRARLLAALLAGGAMYVQAAATALDGRLPRERHGEEFKFVAQIVDFTKVDTSRLVLTAGTDDPALPARLRLAWYEADAVPALGERWLLVARLKVPRGSRNPGGFDYAGWLHRQRIGASGYVLAAQRLALEEATPTARLRRQAVRRIEALLPEDDATAALLAIGVGARHRISRAAWRRYAVTGTSHLMAISGLHIGLAAGAAGLLAWGIGGLLLPRANLRDLAVLAGVPAAAGYAALAGFGVPAQRALLMAAAAAGTLLARRPPQRWTLLALVATLVVLAEPLAVLAPGFWLSFGAVAVLLAAAGHARRRACSLPARSLPARWLGELSALQIALLLGLFPLTAFLFGRSTWLAPLANLVALPVFSIVTVPATLLGLLCAGPAAAVGDVLLWLAWYSLRAVLDLLAALASLPGTELFLAAPRGAARCLFLLPLLWVLLPPGFPGRYLAWLALAAAIAYRPAPPPRGCVDVHTLDVGQGLAVVLRTARRTLLFDAGPAYRGGGSAARAILPFLRAYGIRRLDRLIVSHADGDHAGGVAEVTRALPVADVLAGEPRAGAPTERACRAGQAWRWDDVTFRILHPDRGRLQGNDASCVLEAASAEVRVLLTGDIGAGVERRLVGSGTLAPVALIQVPHHGSATSSSPTFVAALSAQTAVVSAGFANRWGFPKPAVAARWQSAGATLMTTARSGAIHHRLCAQTGAVLLEEYRPATRRYWHDPDD